MKDLFSSDSALYRKARPSYPDEVMVEILKYVSNTQFAWDCGAGSGQFTQLIAPYFEQVVATDLSAQQLQQAPYFDNVSYQVQSAEKTTLADQSFDLITVAQAIHWFDFDEFYKEVKRTLKKDGVFAVIGYGTPHLKQTELQAELSALYYHTLKGYWDAERRYIDEDYKTIPFPFEVLTDQRFTMQFNWTKSQFMGYLNTWSAIKHYRAQNQAEDQSDLLSSFMYGIDEGEPMIVEFPIFLKVGKINKFLKDKKSGSTQAHLQKIFNRQILKFC